MTHRSSAAAPAPDDYIESDNEDGCLLAISSEDEWDRNSPKPDGRYPTPRQLRADPRIPRPFWKTKPGLLVAIAVAVAFILAIFLIFRNSIRIARLRHAGIPPGLYSRDGLLYVGKNTPFRIKGFSWYGMEEENHMPGGLDKVPMDSIFSFAREYKFNAIRLPLSVENIIKDGIGHTNTFQNPELVGLTYLQIVETIVKKAAQDNILILFDVHRLENHEVQSPGLWYTDKVKEQRLFLVWKILCELMRNEWNVVGADIFNEPWNALWNSTETAEDWKRASEHLGDFIHKSCPSWLIFIEGVGSRAKGPKTDVFWAENLRVMESSPPELKLKSKTALSPHVYGPSVFNQTYFKHAEFPDNMPALWDDHFGEASRATGIATVVGEWGGWFVGKDRMWQKKFFSYMMERKISFFYWCLNPESADTGGLLLPDWVTPSAHRLAMLDAAPSTKVGDHSVHFQYWRNWRAG